MDESVRLTVVTEPDVSGGDTIIPVLLSVVQVSPSGSIHSTTGTFSLVTVQVSITESPALGIPAEVLMLTMFSSAAWGKIFCHNVRTIKTL